MKQLWSSKVHVAKASGGLDKFWVIRVMDDGFVYTQTESWHTLKDGSESSHILSAPKRIEPKNVGKSNETTPVEQAISEAESEVVKKVDKGYWPVGEKRPTDSFTLPMLAQKYHERKHNIKYPAYVQPKLDGVRCLMDGKRAWSRQANAFIPEVVQHIMFNTHGVILDGELMLPHDEYTFQETISAVKKARDTSELLEYHVYDIVNPTLTFQQRHAKLINILEGAPPGVRLVPTYSVRDEAEILARHGEFCQAGYEGTMVRNSAGLYKVKDRSNDLQKLKDFQEDEYTIVDVVEGVAKHAGCAVLVCENPSGKRFNVTPKATVVDRKQMFRDRQTLVGKKLTVQYQNLSDDGIPRFPIGRAVRDYE